MPRYKKRNYTTEKVGQLDKRLTIYSTDDDSETGWGETKEVIFHKCWAELMDNRAKDYSLAVQTGANNNLSFRIRYKQGITTDMNVRYNDMHYSIIDVIDEDPRQKYMELIVERKN